MRIQMQRGTAIGSAIVLCLAELFPDHGIDLAEMTFGRSARGAAWTTRHKPPPKQIEPVAPGSYDAAAIILLSDGRRTTGVDTLEAAKMAADRGVRIYVVGLGTPDGHAAQGDGMAIYLQLDEPTLREVARMTGGEYHHAGTAEALRSVYQKLGSRAADADARHRTDGAAGNAGGDADRGGGGAVGAVVRARGVSAQARRRDPLAPIRQVSQFLPTPISKEHRSCASGARQAGPWRVQRS